MEQIALKKSITWLQGAALTTGAVLGSGILVLPGITASLAGPASLISWLLMGLLSLPMVIVIGMMSSRFPDSGGMATYVRQGFGPKAGHLTSLLMLTSMPLGMPVTALIGAHYLGSVFTWSSAEIHLTAAAMLLTAIALNYRGIELSGRTQVLVISLILLILTFAIWSSLPNLSWENFAPFLPHGWQPVGQSMALLFFAFVGWEMIGNLAEEFKNPRHDLPVSLGIALLVVNLLYITIACVTVGTGVYLTGNPTTSLLSLIALRWGSNAELCIAFLGLIACYCPVHTFVAGFSRLVYAQARDGNFSRSFGKLHPCFQTPYKALLFFAPLYLTILFISYAFSFDLKPLMLLPSANFLAVYLLGMLASARVLTSLIGKASAWLSSMLSGLVLIFSGWAILYPLAITILFIGRQYVRQPHSHNSR